MPKISVIIPVYNVENYLKECLDSIINQTLSDIEIICVDDGSTDSSLNILREYAEKDSRIKIIQQENQYAGVARNNGMMIATGEYLHFMDSDDYLFDTNVYEKMYEIAECNQYPNILRFCAQSFDCNSNEYVLKSYYEQKSISSEKMNTFLNIDNDLASMLSLSVVPWQGLVKREFIKENSLEFNSNICSNDLSFFVLSILVAKSLYLSELKIVKHRINNSESLIGIRERFFDCLFVSINLIFDFLSKSDVSKYVKTLVLLHSFSDLFVYYKKYLYKSKYSYKIYKQTVEFVKAFDIDDLKPEIECKNYYKVIKKMKKLNERMLCIDYFIGKSLFVLKNIVNKIFSVTNIISNSGEKQKVIVLLGLKFKIKRDKNV